MEREFIRWLSQRTTLGRGIAVGIGDDAAVLNCDSNSQIVVTTDMLMEGVDFQDVLTKARLIGRKSLAVNLSDLAAMASRPLAAFVAVALPRTHGRKIAEEVLSGIEELAAEFEISIAGGDTNSWDGPLVVCITALGQVTSRGPLLRSGARPGDHLVVTGKLGGSILGHHFEFVPRVQPALWAHENFALHAGLDLSDGLSLDLARMAEASGCAAVIELSSIPISEDAQRLTDLRQDGVSPIEHALHDGEDFELLLAVPADDADKLTGTPYGDLPFTRIGRMVPGTGVFQIHPDGRQVPLLPGGYEHQLT